MSTASIEREALATLFLEVGPDAPTLCEGWTARDLAAHLYIRENLPHKAGGNFLPALEPLLDREMEKQTARPFDEVVAAWAGGPPALIKPIDAVMNGAEHFIHHEDVRRGGGGAEGVVPREFDAQREAELMAWVKRFALLTLRRAPVPVVLTPPSMPPVTAGGKRGVAQRGDAVVRVKGAPGELLLWTVGRRAVRVEVEGDADAIASVKSRI
ncbi:TIGR03085 family metal-binding protein [Corynebacterium liangguodongii]|nr:TIGR03085 family metal-binding protein [Corynebacterium liangguodongii]